MKKIIKVLSLLVAVLFTAVVLFSCSGNKEDKGLKFKELVVETGTYTVGDPINRSKKLALTTEEKIKQALSTQIDIVVSPEVSQFVSAEHGFALHIVLDNPNGSSITRISINGTYYYGSSLIQAPQVIGETLNDLFVNVSGEVAGIKDYEITDIRYTVYGTDTETSFGSTQWGTAERVVKVGVTISDWDFSVHSTIVRNYTSITVDLNNLVYPAFAVENEYTLLAVLLNASNSTVLVSNELDLSEGHWTLTYDNLTPNGNYNLAISLACDLQLTTNSNILVTPMSISGFSVTPKLITADNVNVVLDVDYTAVEATVSTSISGWHVTTPTVNIVNLNVNTHYERSLNVVVANDEDSSISATVSKEISYTTLAHELEDLSIVQLSGRSYYNQTPISVGFTNADGYIVNQLLLSDGSFDGSEMPHTLNVNSSTGLASVNYNFNFNASASGVAKTWTIIGYVHSVTNANVKTVHLETPISFNVNMNTISGYEKITIIDVLVNGEHSYGEYTQGEVLTYTFIFNQDISGLNVNFIWQDTVSVAWNFHISGNTLTVETYTIYSFSYPFSFYVYLDELFPYDYISINLYADSPLYPEVTEL
jgi:hypothetical protein